MRVSSKTFRFALGGMTGPAVLLAIPLATLTSPAAASARAQSPTHERLQAEIRDLDEMIALLEEIIRDMTKPEGDIYMPPSERMEGLGPGGGGVIVRREQVATFYSRRILLGDLTVQQVTEKVQEHMGTSRIALEQGFKPDLQELRDRRARRAAQLAELPPPQPLAADPAGGPGRTRDFLGEVEGNWGYYCDAEGKRLPFSGTFRLVFDGSGRISGWYEDDQYQYPVSGGIDETGSARGDGNTPLGRFLWKGTFQQRGDKLVLREPGEVQFYPSDRNYTCDRGSWTVQ